MNLCRTAMESAARAIWTLNDTDRDERRRRSLGVIAAEMKEQQYYLTTTESGHANGDHVLAPQEYEQFLEHQRDFTVRRSFVQAARKTKAPSFREAVVQVSEWLATYPPVHNTDGLTRGLCTAASGSTTSVRPLCTVTSGCMNHRVCGGAVRAAALDPADLRNEKCTIRGICPPPLPPGRPCLDRSAVRKLS